MRVWYIYIRRSFKRLLEVNTNFTEYEDSRTKFFMEARLRGDAG